MGADHTSSHSIMKALLWAAGMTGMIRSTMSGYATAHS